MPPRRRSADPVARSARLTPTLSDLVDETLSLLTDYRPGAPGSSPSVGPPSAAPLSSDALTSLLDQCRALVEEAGARRPEPVRVLQHVACSGGTIISKCLAAMPNTTLLSEIDPLSRVFTDSGKSKAIFTPSDLITQLYYSRHPEDPDLYAEIFMAGLGALLRKSAVIGRHVVVRVHSHSQFFTPVEPSGRPTVPDIIRRQHSVLSVVTLRHPLDSWLSMTQLAWVQFKPVTLDEYARRYLQFLDSTKGLPTVRYEDFVAAPEPVLEQLCGSLDLPYSFGTPGLIGAIRVSGDSGRSDTAIGPRPRREIPAAVRAEFDISPTYRRLCEELGYDPHPT